MAKSKEEQREYDRLRQKKYREAHPERQAEAVRKYTAAHPDRRRESQKKHRDAHYEKIRIYSQVYSQKRYKANPEKVRRDSKASFLKRRYGITIEEWDAMFEKQKGCCAICSRHASELKRGLDVDHDHKTGKVRGLLCRDCNSGMGSLKDDTSVLEKALQYLRGH